MCPYRLGSSEGARLCWAELALGIQQAKTLFNDVPLSLKSCYINCIECQCCLRNMNWLFWYRDSERINQQSSCLNFMTVTFRGTDVPRGWWIITHHLVFGEPPHTWGIKHSSPYKVNSSYLSSFWLPEVCCCHLVVLKAKNSYKYRCLFSPLKLIAVQLTLNKKTFQQRNHCQR